jgi:hypothetical protein
MRNLLEFELELAGRGDDTCHRISECAAPEEPGPSLDDARDALADLLHHRDPARALTKAGLDVRPLSAGSGSPPEDPTPEALSAMRETNLDPMTRRARSGLLRRLRDAVTRDGDVLSVPEALAMAQQAMPKRWLDEWGSNAVLLEIGMPLPDDLLERFRRMIPHEDLPAVVELSHRLCAAKRGSEILRRKLLDTNG